MAINNYNRGSVQEQVDRVQFLMGINKPQTNENKKVAPLGIIEKTEIGADGNCYAIIKENSRYYLKKSPDTKDIKLDNFEYLGGSHRYKHLYEYNSYNQAEKVLSGELFNVSKDVKKQSVLAEQTAKVDMNLAQTVTSKEMREEIERQRQIMTNASSILNEDAGIKNPEKTEPVNEAKGNINELSIDDDEQILTDNGDSDIDADEVISLDDDSDSDLDAQDVQLDQQLVTLIPDLLAKMDQLNDQLSRLTDDDGEFDEFEVEELGENVVSEGSESSDQKTNDHGMSTIASTITNSQFDYNYAQEDPRGRNNLPSYNKDTKNGIDGNIGPQNIHKDTLDDVDDVIDRSNTRWNKDDEVIDVVENANVGRGKEFYIVERDGTVMATIKESDFQSMLNAGKPKNSKDPSKSLKTSRPFSDKVQQLTDNIFKECVASGIFKIKK